MDGSNYQAIVQNAAIGSAEGSRLAASAPMAEQARSGLVPRLAHPICVTVAAAIHVAIAALMLAGKADEFGESGTALQAIAVDVVEAMPSMASLAAAASDGPAAEPVEQVPDEALPPHEPAAPRADTSVEAATDIADAARSIAPPPPISPAPKPDMENKSEPEPQSPQPQPSSAPAQAASAASVAVGEANQGVVNAYGAALSRIISRGRPQGRETRNLRGTVVVEFVVGTSGGLERADVKVSSGNSRLDDLGVSALRKLELPAPTPDMTLKQRTFTVPFVYR